MGYLVGPWVEARQCPVLSNRPHREATFANFSILRRFHLNSPWFCFELLKCYFSSFQNDNIPKTCTEDEVQTRCDSHKCLDPAGKRGCQDFPLTELVASNDIGVRVDTGKTSHFKMLQLSCFLPGLHFIVTAGLSVAFPATALLLRLGPPLSVASHAASPGAYIRRH